MSRSNNTELTNPAEKFFEWDASTGGIRYYDKEAEQNVSVELPFQFLVLDKVSQIGGGIDRGDGYQGFWSNAVRNTKDQSFTVRSKAGIEARGLYEQIKGTPGIKFTIGLYIAFKQNDALVIGMLKFKGAALTAWIEFVKAHRNIYSGAFRIIGKMQKKKGTNTYFEPELEFNPNVTEATDQAAKMLDEKVQEYLIPYFAQTFEASTHESFAEPHAQAATAGADASTATADYPDDSDIPF